MAIRIGTLPALLALIIVAEEGIRFALRNKLRRRRRKVDQLEAHGAGQYGGLESLVSFSACLIAANRAVETEQPEPYIRDPLAGGLCGQEALGARRNAAAPSVPGRTAAAAAVAASSPAPGTELQAQTGPRMLQMRPIPRLVMRTRFFDDVVTAVTWRGGGPGAEAASRSCHVPLLLAAATAGQPCLQVVLLGSGLDARPWRLPLPSGVRWFEVDRHDVLSAKRARLQALGAQTDADDAPAPAQTPAAAAAGFSDPYHGLQEQERHHAHRQQQQQQEPQQQQRQEWEEGQLGRHQANGGGAWCYPLHVAAWNCCSVDLQRRGWSRGLLDRGLDRNAPVLWVLEGLLYYLQEGDVCALLQEAASISAPGSILAASVIRSASGDCDCAAAAAAAAPTRTLPLPQPPAPPVEGTAGPGEAEGGAARPSGGRAPSGAGRAGYNLTSQFKWKCRVEIPQFFANCGWRSLACLSWLDAARAYGFPTAETTASSVFFLTAALA